MSNKKKYEEIIRAKNSQPAQTWSALCKQNGVSYQSFAAWRQKNRNVAVAAAPVAQGASTVGVLVPIADIVKALHKGEKLINIALGSLLSKLSNKELELVDRELGKQIRAKHKNSENRRSDDGMAERSEIESSELAVGDGG